MHGIYEYTQTYRVDFRRLRLQKYTKVKYLSLSTGLKAWTATSETEDYH